MERAVKRHLRAKVHAGRIELLEPCDLPEGSEVDLMVEVPEPPKKLPTLAFGEWDLGVRQPLTREDIYEDVG
jgi:hypothetical protein